MNERIKEHMNKMRRLWYKKVVGWNIWEGRMIKWKRESLQKKEKENFVFSRSFLQHAFRVVYQQ